MSDFAYTIYIVQKGANMKAKFTKYVHEFTDDFGETRYAVAEWDEFHGQWVAPLDHNTRALTGCSAEYARTLNGLGGYKSRARALRRARYLYGGQ